MLAAFDRLRDAGVIIIRAEVPDDVKTVLGTAFTIIFSELQSAISGFLAEQAMGISFNELVAQVGPDLKGLLATPPPSKAAYDAAVVQRQKIRDAIRGHFEKENIATLAFPPAMIPAHTIEEDGSLTVRGEKVPSSTTMGRNVSLSSCAGMASLVLPAGLTRSGLPVGLEYDALPGTDRTLLGLGVSLQRALGSIQAPIWTIGCASGEEPFSFLLFWKERFEKNFPSIHLYILATDINEKLLERAKEGRYKKSSLKEVSNEFFRRYFKIENGFYILDESIRRSVEFRRHEIVHEEPFSEIDIIFCRNLAFTYFSKETQMSVLKKIVSSLTEEGYLIIGKGESLPLTYPTLFVPIEKIYQRFSQK